MTNDNNLQDKGQENIPQQADEKATVGVAPEGVTPATANPAVVTAKPVGEEDEFHAAPDQKRKRWSAKVAPVRKQEDSGFIEKVITINRITKVTKGGKKLSFSALVVVGDGKGKVGFSLDKAREVSIAIQKSLRIAKRKMIDIPVVKGTIPHEIIGRCGGARVLLKPAFEGTGVIAAGPVRAICDACGIHNILTKCHRSNNPINVIKATIDALTHLKTVETTGEKDNVSA
jgi:small subunit ribosomal protein S5